MRFLLALMAMAFLTGGSVFASEKARLRSVEAFGYFYALAEELEAKCVDIKVQDGAKNGAFSDGAFLSDEDYSAALEIAEGLHEKAKSVLADKDCAEGRMELMKHTELLEEEVFQ